MIGEKNKLIAEFMGTFNACDNYGNARQMINEAPIRTWKVHIAKYHTSWDWLMPVVEKLESISHLEYNCFKVDIEDKYCRIQGWETNRQPVTLHQSTYGKEYATKIEAVYEAVIEFIMFYNDPNYLANKFYNQHKL